MRVFRRVRAFNFDTLIKKISKSVVSQYSKESMLSWFRVDSGSEELRGKLQRYAMRVKTRFHTLESVLECKQP